MRIWGKVFGAIFGFMVGRLFGAIVGVWLGHLFDKGLMGDFSQAAKGGFGSADELQQNSTFFYTTFAVMGHVAKAKGRVTEQEIAFASNYMTQLGLTDELRQQAQQSFREGKHSEFPLKQILKDFKRSCFSRRDLLTMFLEIQIQVAFADGELDSSERKVLHDVARILGFSTVDLDKLLEMIVASAQFNHGKAAPTASQLANAYKVLGVVETDDDKTIKRAYKKLMSQHHPDKLVAKGLPQEMMVAAKQKTQDIQAAYDSIMKHR